MFQTNRKVAVPWKSIWSSVPVWAFVATICVFYAAAFSTVIFLPLYFNDVLSFTIAEVKEHINQIHPMFDHGNIAYFKERHFRIIAFDLRSHHSADHWATLRLRKGYK